MKKEPWKSPTAWAGLVLALMMFIPGMSEQMSPELSASVTALVMALVRTFLDGDAS